MSELHPITQIILGVPIGLIIGEALIYLIERSRRNRHK